MEATVQWLWVTPFMQVTVSILLTAMPGWGQPVPLGAVQAHCVPPAHTTPNHDPWAQAREGWRLGQGGEAQSCLPRAQQRSGGQLLSSKEAPESSGSCEGPGGAEMALI